MRDYSDCKHASSLISQKCDPHSSHKHFLTPTSAPQRPAKSLRPRFLLVHGALLGRSITPTTCPDLKKSAPQASGQVSLSMKGVLAYDSVCLTTPRELHKASIADHTCIILLVIDLPFKPHFISPSSILPSSPLALPIERYSSRLCFTVTCYVPVTKRNR